MTTQAEFIQANAIDGVLTPDQAAQLLELPEGDTGITPETSGQPEATKTEIDPATVQPATGTTVDAPKTTPEPEKAVLLAKDGVHTIDYSKLVEAREGEKHWKAQAAAMTEKLLALQAEADQRAAAGEAPTAGDNATALAAAAIASGEVDPAIFGDYSEEAIAKGIQTLVDARVGEAMSKIDQKLQPLQVQQAQSATEQHYGAIYEKHPDADSIAESAELASWIEKQPSFARAGYQAVLTDGTAAEIIEMFDSFKETTGKTQAAAPSKEAIAAAAQAAIAKARAPVPTSLTDIPGGTAGPGSKFEALDAMSGPAMSEALQGMTPEQIETYLNRQF